MVGVLADPAIAGAAAQRPQLALDRDRQVGGLPLRGAALDIVEDQGGRRVDPAARRAGLGAQRPGVAIDPRRR
jgi:hypothetical protein